VTKDIVKAASTLGIMVHDHLIIGRGGHASLRDLGLLSSPRTNTKRPQDGADAPTFSAGGA
jgi:hypothetical protein